MSIPMTLFLLFCLFTTLLASENLKVGVIKAESGSIFAESFDWGEYNGEWKYVAQDTNNNPYYQNPDKKYYLFYNTVWNYWIIYTSVNPSGSSIQWYTYCSCGSKPCDACQCRGNDWIGYETNYTALCYSNYCSEKGTCRGTMIPTPAPTTPTTASPTPYMPPLYAADFSWSQLNGIWKFVNFDENGNPYYTVDGTYLLFFNTYWDYWIVYTSLNPSDGYINYYTYCACNGKPCDVCTCRGDDWVRYNTSNTNLCYSNYCSKGGTCP